jgi:hypothetical protein
MKPVARETDRSPVKRVFFHPPGDYALNAVSVGFFPLALSTPLLGGLPLMRQHNSLCVSGTGLRQDGALLY